MLTTVHGILLRIPLVPNEEIVRLSRSRVNSQCEFHPRPCHLSSEIFHLPLAHNYHQTAHTLPMLTVPPQISRIQEQSPVSALYPYPLPPLFSDIYMKANPLHFSASNESADNKGLTRRKASENRRFSSENTPNSLIHFFTHCPLFTVHCPLFTVHCPLVHCFGAPIPHSIFSPARTVNGRLG